MADDIREAIGRMGLAASRELVLEPLAGGVASDIYRVDAGGRTFAVKRALDRLRVAAEWRVPTDRNANEVAWLRLAGQAVPGAAPAVLGHDAASGCFAMAYLDPATHPVWKSELMAGRVDPGFSGAVGGHLAAIHAATAGDPSVAAAFDTIRIFHSIRLEPYLEATAARHPALASILMALSRETALRRIALVHGDVSPKNILVGAAGPVFLDAECAWYGDPAFDLAFCLNHLLLKRIALPAAADPLSAAFEELATRYLDGVTWEDAGGLEARAAALLPALLLARIDGKSPVEYITGDADKARVRRAAVATIRSPVGRLSDVLARAVEGFGERAAAR